MSRLIKRSSSPASSENVRPIGLRQVAPDYSQNNHEVGKADTGETTADREESRLEKKRKEIKVLKQQAEEELQETRRKISEEEENSKQRIEQAYTDARQEGWKQGIEEGRQEGYAAVEDAVQEAKQTITAAQAEYHQYLERAEPVILDLALTIANRIIYDSLEDHDGTWMEIVKNAVKEVKDHEEVAVYVPLSRLEETRKQRNEMQNLLAYSQDLLIYPDSSLGESDCIIETPYGKVDASLDSQLQELKEQLEEKLKEGGMHESS
ncbi:flagellar assembly protein FliH [Salibacterium halotolerans]|uniref:Flagellar assembly protein FliH n=1 Tax=Salibacterium halotolerans TaxID=1884432 RepID=A0A1I5MEQ1_9BACI|nr:flagellar assembly protein FliH [Salibacterium halotolerans]SFP07436.1 flagellar assembly protein FliH [Salibacterium halotolerans]